MNYKNSLVPLGFPNPLIDFYLFIIDLHFLDVSSSSLQFIVNYHFFLLLDSPDPLVKFMSTNTKSSLNGSWHSYYILLGLSLSYSQDHYFRPFLSSNIQHHLAQTILSFEIFYFTKKLKYSDKILH